jgi:tripartite-type tricarboxylate transporter receptor subunit TctC
MDSSRPSISRRQLVKIVGTAGVAGTAGLSGCLGEGDGGDGGGGGGEGGGDETQASPDGDTNTPADNETPEPTEEDFWPPPRDQVDMVAATGPGGTLDLLSRHWSEASAEFFPGDIRATVTNRPGANGLIAVQDTHSAPTDGSTLGSFFYSHMNDADQNLEGVSQSDFRSFVSFYQDIRGLQVSHVARDIDNHFQWTWDDVVESAQEQSFRIASVTPAHTTIMEFAFGSDDRLSEDDYAIVEFDSGSSARQSMLRGDIDAYPTGFGSGYATDRAEFGKMQILFSDPDLYPDLAETFSTLESGDGLADGAPESAYLVNQNFPEQEANDIARIFISGTHASLPPGTPDEILDIFVDAYSQAAESDDLRQTVTDSLGALRFVPTVGEEAVTTILDNRLDAIMNSERYRELTAE